MVEKTVATYGRRDFAFNNARVEEPLTPLAEKTEALYRQVMDTNVKGVCFSMQAEIPAMLERGGGVDCEHGFYRRPDWFREYADLCGKQACGLFGMTKASGAGICQAEHPRERRFSRRH